MRASYQWLKQLSGVEATAAQYATWLTSLGLEVEAIESRGGHKHIVIAEVRGKRSVEGKDKLALVTVFDGTEEQEVICGAPNVPEAGGRVLLAKLGAFIPGLGFSIEERKIGGIPSKGMLCSSEELELGTDGDGIFVVPESVDAKPGTAIDDALELSDTIFEIGLTPNRPDALGHIGLAREICLAASTTFELKQPDLPDVKGQSPLTVTIEDEARCPRYAGAHLTDITIAPSPFWLQYRLHNLGVRPINNVVDVTNLVLLETGHPTHAFDFRTLEGQSIVVRTAKKNERLTTLDGEQRELAETDLLICDGARPAALAGIMGGADSEIKDDTQEVVFECAYFLPTSIRKTAKRLGMHTDASHRFERGVDPNGVADVTARGIHWLTQLCGARLLATPVDVYPTEVTRADVTLRRSRVDRLLGYPVDDAEVARTLDAIGCDAESIETGWHVRCPTHRPDLTIEADLIEEVARAAGLDRCPAVMPGTIASAEAPTRRRLHGEIRRAAAGAGLSEAINYAFVDPNHLKTIGLTSGVAIKNPLSEEKSVMRPSLVPGLLRNAEHALRHQVDSGGLFEIGRIFEQQGPGLPVQRTMFAIALFGQRQQWIGAGKEVDFYDLKGCIETTLRAVSRRPVGWATIDSAPAHLHPKKCAAFNMDGRAIGYAAMLHPDVGDALDLARPVAIAELDLDALVDVVLCESAAADHPLPRFPASRRDLALLLDEAYTAEQIVEQIRERGGDLVEAVDLFDLYRGDTLPEGKKSMAFRIQYRDREQTLTDKKVEKIHDAVVKHVAKVFEASLR